LTLTVPPESRLPSARQSVPGCLTLPDLILPQKKGGFTFVAAA
jgi:hypothetical protein